MRALRPGCLACFSLSMAKDSFSTCDGPCVLCVLIRLVSSAGGRARERLDEDKRMREACASQPVIQDLQPVLTKIQAAAKKSPQVPNNVLSAVSACLVCGLHERCARRMDRFRAKREQLEDFYLKPNTRIWPCLSYLYHVRSTAVQCHSR